MHSLKKDVKINIVGIQTVNGEREVVEVFTEGNYCEKNGCYYISYMETEETGFAGAKTTLKVDKDKEKVVLLRSKPAESQLVIEKGGRHLCSYNTGYGNVMIGISGTKITSHLNEKGGSLDFKYTMDMESALLSINEIHMKIEEC